MSTTWDAKDPDDVARYHVAWTDKLGSGDTVATSTFTLLTAAGLSKVSEDNDTTSSSVVLSGGTAGLVAILNCRITTAAGDQFDEEITLAIDSGLVVEDGTGKADAEALADVATAQAYCVKRGLAFTGRKGELENCLRVGFDWLKAKTYKGSKTQGRAQAGPFPRVGCTDRDGETIASDEIPIEMVHANIELAVYERANPGGLSPATTPTQRVRRVREKVGPLETETEYAAVAATSDQDRPDLARVADLIGGFLANSGGSLLSGRAMRS